MDDDTCEAPQPGSRAGYAWHVRHGGGAAACDACKTAEADRFKEWRQIPEVRARHNADSRERSQRPEVRDYQREYQRAYRQRPEVKAAGRERNRNRKKAKRRKALAALESRDGPDCFYCGRRRTEFQEHVDHVLPGAKGADTGWQPLSNLVIACPGCNLSKHDDYIWDWIARPDVAAMVRPEVHEFAAARRAEWAAAGGAAGG